MMNEESVLSTNLQVDDVSYSHLLQTARWARFLAIVGIILSCVLVLIALFAGTFLGLIMRDYNDSPAMSTATLSIIYILIAALYLFTSLYLYRFAVKMRGALQQNDQEQFNAALSNQRIFYKIIGIIMIIYLVIMALAILLMIFFIGSSSMR